MGAVIDRLILAVAVIVAALLAMKVVPFVPTALAIVGAVAPAWVR